MSKLDELIQELCPEGVEYMQLGAIEDAGLIKLGRGSVISKKDIAAEPGDYPIYSSSASGVGEFGRYGKYMFDDERLSWSVDGGGRFFYRHPHKYSVTNVSGWLKVLDSSRIDIKYLFYALDSAWSTKKFDYTKKAHPSVIRNEYKIPLLPLEVQKEIASILDKFTQLEAELSAELEARRKQYEYYTSKLFLFGDEVESIELKNIADFSQGVQVDPSRQSLDKKEGYVRFLRIVDFVKENEPPRYISDPGQRYLKKEGDLVMIRYGASAAGRVFMNSKGAIANNMFQIKIKAPNISTKYIYYYLAQPSVYRNLNSNGGGSTMPAITFGQVGSVKIPIPSLEDQRKIVSIFEKFDTMTNDLSQGLPAEINARRKQYEYYRTKLLTFQELSA